MHRSKVWFVSMLVLLLVAAACGNADDDESKEPDDTSSEGDSSSGDTTGVTDTEIKVGGIVSLTGPLGQQFAGSEAGFRAYMSYINDQGGVHGRKINIVRIANDNTDAARNLEEATALVEQDEVFAIGPVSTPVFGAAQYLADEGVPTFGWNIQFNDWRLGENLMGNPTSWYRPEEPPPILGAAQSYIAKSLGHSKVGVISYTAPQSKQCADDSVKAYEQFGMDVVFIDTSLPLGTTDFTADVEKMKDADLEYLQTCIDVNGNVTLARSLERAGLDIDMSWPTGYEQETLESFSDLLEGVYFTSIFLPFENADQSEALQLYLEEMPAREPDAAVGNQTLIGWVNAMLMVDGLEAAGPELTREGLVDAIRSFDAWDAGGIQAPADYTTPPEDREELSGCGGAVVTVKDAKFQPVFNEPFLCLVGITTEAELDAVIAEEKAS